MILINVIAGFLIAILAGLGVGGGGLLVIWLTYATDIPQIEAQGINLVFFLAASSASLIYHIKKRKLNYKVLSVLSLSGVVGTVFGYAAAAAAPTELLRRFFGGLLILSGAIVLFRKRKGSD